MKPKVQSHVDHAERAAVLTTDFDHPIEVVWTLFSDPAKLERWWGPPGMPMTVDRHDLRPGGTVEVTVTTDGGVIRGHWTIRAVDAPTHLSFTFESDGLDPTAITVDITATSDASATMAITARFVTDDDLRHALDIGFTEGLARSCASAHAVIGS
ncbi:MAG: SRPBCC domain-containing protein [Actinomycetota bacterium]|nr:SRPBCC domain-containing protein [Actinomycetota bacterium]